MNEKYLHYCAGDLTTKKYYLLNINSNTIYIFELGDHPKVMQDSVDFEQYLRECGINDG